MISGKDKGKTGKVLRAFPRENKIVVEGINIHKRHQKSRQEGKKGQTIEMPFPLDVSNARKQNSK